MNFFIRQGSTRPILKLRLIDDGKTDKSFFNDSLITADIKFDMKNIKTGEYQVLNGNCLLSFRKTKTNFNTNEYYIVYLFNEQDTSIIGKYEGIVTITFKNVQNTPTSKLIVPIREKLFINVI